MSTLTQFDHYLKDSGPSAIVLREHLMPVEGIDGVVFPSTYTDIGYNIDKFDDGTNVCLVDSIGSQANRIEPMFKGEPYRGLVPQVVIIAGEKDINLLDAGHRAGDAIVRCSELETLFNQAFKNVLKGDCEALAKVSPTSLVFGVWDSRDTQAKIPRVIASTIRAYNVRKLTRSAQYVPATEYVANKLLDEPSEAQKKEYSERGFIHVPSVGVAGGVLADGGIRRDAILALAAVRLLTAGKDESRTLALRRYILGLALTAFTHPSGGYLRQGCLLVINPDKPVEFVEVLPTGIRTPCTITHEQATEYALAAAKAFGVGENRSVHFTTELAKKDMEKSKDAKKDKNKSKDAKKA
ncbi:MAG: type I-U CRISPR-associated RAMP protein Csb1/Cas7u [Verrucomicrobiota bacterium]|nr:type I-U CRISPR-associated RAMP protein Csb1/Cas7u [Verrucomicrobiota bacterium]